MGDVPDVPSASASPETTQAIIKYTDKDIAARIIKNKVKRVSLKQRKWLAEYAKDGDSIRATMQVYHTSMKNSYVIAHDLLAKIDFIELMDVMGISDQLLNSKLKEGLGATKIVEQAREFKEAPDYAVRHKYLETGLKLRGRIDSPTTTINVDKMLVMDGTNTPKPVQSEQSTDKAE